MKNFSDHLPPPGGAPASTSPTPDELAQMLMTQNEEFAFAILSSSGDILSWRGAAEKIFGYSEGEARGRSISLIFDESDCALGMPEHERNIANADGRAEDDRWHVRKDGTKIWISGAMSAIRNGAGENVGFGKIMRDRTTLRAQIETLENRAALLTRQHETKDRMFANVVHEIRNSLTPLSVSMELISRSGATSPSTLAMIRRQLDLLTRLANDGADVAQTVAGKLLVAPTVVDLLEQVNAVVGTIVDRAHKKTQTLQVLAPHGAIQIEADSIRLHQIVFNLLDNAIKYTPARGQIWVKLTIEGPDAVIHVEDNGRGIDGALLPRIFDLFVQAEQSTSEGGFGVGLSLVRDLVHAHRGTVEVRSDGIGHGTEFTVRIPLAQ